MKNLQRISIVFVLGVFCSMAGEENDNNLHWVWGVAAGYPMFVSGEVGAMWELGLIDGYYDQHHGPFASGFLSPVAAGFKIGYTFITPNQITEPASILNVVALGYSFSGIYTKFHGNPKGYDSGQEFMGICASATIYGMNLDIAPMFEVGANGDAEFLLMANFGYGF